LETYNIDPNLISQKNFKTKSILAVHLYGQLAEMEVNEIALQMIFVIEDAAQAHGATLVKRSR
jgi:dTDP-4-amino-4,6-dideoxygalactose transaminase